MVLLFETSQLILQTIALAMVKAKQPKTKIRRQVLLRFLHKRPIWQQQEVDPADWLDQMLEVSELLVEREPGEYEFLHLSFQGFFAATLLAQPQDTKRMQANAQLILQNWNGAVWREAVLLYTAQLTPKLLGQVIRKACELGSEAAELASVCLKEYPRPEKVSAELSQELRSTLESLQVVTQDSKYQKLEALLQAQQWREADEETYCLMITTVGKEEGQWFDLADLEIFPCEDWRTLEQLWVKYSNGKWGFSVQKRSWQECGSPMDYSQYWEKFGDRVGWRKEGDWFDSYDDFTFNLGKSLPGEFPLASVGGVGGGRVVGLVGLVGVVSLARLPLFSRTKTCSL
jgi:hypothetical protein